MSDDRLAPSIEAGALLRRASAVGGFGAVLQKGDADRGTILVILLERNGPPCTLQRLLGSDGRYAWSVRHFADSAALEQHVVQARSRDPDMWVLELDIPSRERFIAEMT